MSIQPPFLLYAYAQHLRKQAAPLDAMIGGGLKKQKALRAGMEGFGMQGAGDLRTHLGNAREMGIDAELRGPVEALGKSTVGRNVDWQAKELGKKFPKDMQRALSREGLSAHHAFAPGSAKTQAFNALDQRMVNPEQAGRADLAKRLAAFKDQKPQAAAPVAEQVAKATTPKITLDQLESPKRVEEMRKFHAERAAAGKPKILGMPIPKSESIHGMQTAALPAAEASALRQVTATPKMGLLARLKGGLGRTGGLAGAGLLGGGAGAYGLYRMLTGEKATEEPPVQKTAHLNMYKWANSAMMPVDSGREAVHTNPMQTGINPYDPSIKKEDPSKEKSISVRNRAPLGVAHDFIGGQNTSVSLLNPTDASGQSAGDVTGSAS